MKDSTGLLIGVGLVGAFILVARYQLSYKRFPYEQFIDLASTKYIADQLPQAEDDFILGAWDFVGGGLRYEAVGSNITFVNNSVVASQTTLPAETLRRGRGNCVALSAVLTSILRHRLPPSRVYMAMGQVYLMGNWGGHSWVEVDRGGWQLLEATVPPGTPPWVSVEKLEGMYEAEVLFNDVERVCYSEKVCVVVSGRHCPACLDRAQRRV